MFERYTDRARRVVTLATGEANLLGHADITTGHILLALITEGDGIAGQALKSLGVTLDGARERLRPRIVSQPAEDPHRVPLFRPQAMKVLEIALREALQLGHNYVGTEHILLALAREGDQAGAGVLEIIGLSADGVRAKVVELLRGRTVQGRWAPPESQRWRTRPQAGHMIYVQYGAEPSDDDALIGMMASAELAQAACAAHNRLRNILDSGEPDRVLLMLGEAVEEIPAEGDDVRSCLHRRVVFGGPDHHVVDESLYGYAAPGRPFAEQAHLLVSEFHAQCRHVAGPCPFSRTISSAMWRPAGVTILLPPSPIAASPAVTRAVSTSDAAIPEMRQSAISSWARGSSSPADHSPAAIKMTMRLTIPSEVADMGLMVAESARPRYDPDGHSFVAGGGIEPPTSGL
jgi:Clp amino terminal domain, pathogenicity island component